VRFAAWYKYRDLGSISRRSQFEDEEETDGEDKILNFQPKLPWDMTHPPIH
jgi:hypothetical protein